MWLASAYNRKRFVIEKFPDSFKNKAYAQSHLAGLTIPVGRR